MTDNTNTAQVTQADDSAGRHLVDAMMEAMRVRWTEGQLIDLAANAFAAYRHRLAQSTPADGEGLVERLRQREAMATPGPWQVQDGNSHRRIGAPGKDGNVIRPARYSEQEPNWLTLDGDRIYADMMLIVEMRNALPAILATLRSTAADPVPEGQEGSGFTFGAMSASNAIDPAVPVERLPTSLDFGEELSAKPDGREVVEAWAFLRERLRDLDFSQDADDLWRDFAGHVNPAIGRLDAEIAALANRQPVQE